MSDQTPETSMDAAEPSMEDILASIRKIIADDDAPVNVTEADLSPADLTSDDLTAQDEQSFGNISDLVELRTETAPIAERETLTDAVADDDAAPLMDLEIEHFDADPVLTHETQPSGLEAISSFETMDLSDVADNAAREMPQNLPETTPELSAIESLVLDDTDLTDTLSTNELADIDVADFDLDLETEFDEIADLEIPTPDPSEALMSDAANLANMDDNIVTRPGMASAAIAGAGGVGAAALGVFGGLKDTAENTDISADISQGLSAEDVDTNDIDAALSELLDTTSPVEESQIAIVDDVQEALDMSPKVELADVDLTQAELTDAQSLDDDLSAMVEETSQQVDTDIEAVPVSDNELDALLEEMSLVAEEPETIAEPENIIETVSEDISTEAKFDDALGFSDDDAEDSGEDADLLLVKSLMADLADYNADEFEADIVGDIDTNIDMGTTSEVDNIDDLSVSFDDLNSDDLNGNDLDTLDLIDDALSDDEIDAVLASDIPDDMDDDDAVILDEILNMALDDELASQDAMELDSADAVAALEIDNLAANVELDTAFEAVEAGAVPSESFSLSEIAAAAQADADEETGFGAILAGIGSASVGTAGVVAAASLAQSGDEVDAPELGASEADIHALTQFDEAEIHDTDNKSGQDDVDRILAKLLDDDVAADIDEDTGNDDNAEIVTEFEQNDLQTLEPETLEPEILLQEATDASESRNLPETSEEITQMPRAATKNTDVIMDDMTEAATASVFAELNQVVEEKAIVAERGDRVGDLVMEALRPMLKDWLDTNLKGIVERAVAKEVKRISSGK